MKLVAIATVGLKEVVEHCAGFYYGQVRALAALVALMAVAVVVVVVRPPISDPALAHELIRMARQDTAARSDALAAATGLQDASLAEIGERLLDAGDDVAAIEAANLARMKEIVRDHGWPDRREVGREGAHSAWLVVSRGRDVALQEQALALMQRDAKHVDSGDVAFLVDRIAVAKGQPQTYGTQFTCVDGAWRFATPVQGNPDMFREARRTAGLESFNLNFRDLELNFGPCRSQSTDEYQVVVKPPLLGP